MTNDTLRLRLLPDADQLGQRDEFTLPIGTGDDSTVIDATFLGLGTSERPTHRDHVGKYANPARNERCTACRWFELRIFRVESGGRGYVMHYTGRSIVPGETQRYRIERVVGSYEAVEQLTVRRDDAGRREVYLPGPAARALAQAASFDEDIQEAYIDRAVS